jgi:hypothetical protein
MTTANTSEPASALKSWAQTAVQHVCPACRTRFMALVETLLDLLNKDEGWDDDWGTDLDSEE